MVYISYPFNEYQLQLINEYTNIPATKCIPTPLLEVHIVNSLKIYWLIDCCLTSSQRYFSYTQDENTFINTYH